MADGQALLTLVSVLIWLKTERLLLALPTQPTLLSTFPLAKTYLSQTEVRHSLSGGWYRSYRCFLERASENGRDGSGTLAFPAPKEGTIPQQTFLGEKMLLVSL